MIGRLFHGRTSLLPRDAGGEAWLAGLIAVLCFLACLSAVGAVSADRAAHGWARELRSEATVQVRPRVGETGAEAAARAAQTLAGVEGVSEAEAMDRETAEALLRPWIGDAVLPDLPIPHLVTVRLDPTAPASAVTLGRAMAEAGLDATVDDHSLWRGEVERSAGLITLLAVAAFLLTAGAAGAAVAYATRAGMAAQSGVINTLSLNGGADSAVAGLYQARYGLLAAGAGAIGALTAMAVVAGLRFLGGAEGVTPALPLAWSDLLILSPCPLLAATVALVAARFTALARLKRGH
ncbi:MAG: ABC transporter permease [Alphaproteobacteria bacterium]|jgi:cell division transport system permease protein|nr:ABC transporter permease [Alphaproteobacteria bacterium]MBU2040401.1 ABC transporter permease [Alphaproteobacteria bacterium]MBU2125477.1 ABC transporter permease [Alphaproteobacteria bacterium]MBU2209040.1 ABC transporter permease [Alphaproteobacteria bacterium]MBU2291374.1 ABC transporter permease [Alphaproteobacteria bacterium]